MHAQSRNSAVRFAPTTPGRANEGSPIARVRFLLFLAVLAIWVLMGYSLEEYGYDAVPFLVAPDMAQEDPTNLYQLNAEDLWDVNDAFGQRAAEYGSTEIRGDRDTLPFVSPPIAIPIGAALKVVGGGDPVRLMRVLAALIMAAGMFLVWREVSDRAPLAEEALIATVVFVTPMVWLVLRLGQNSPLMFLLSCVAVSTAVSGRRSASLGLGLSVMVAMKLFPVALIVLLAWLGLRKPIAWALAGTAGLTVATLFMAPANLYGDFIDASSKLSEAAPSFPSNASLDALMWSVIPQMTDNRLLWGMTLLVRAAAVGIGLRIIIRRGQPDVAWGFGCLSLVLFTPLLWVHYLLVALGAVALGVARCARPAKWIILLPTTALVLGALPILQVREAAAVPATALTIAVLVSLVAMSKAGDGRIPVSVPTSEPGNVSLAP